MNAITHEFRPAELSVIPLPLNRLLDDASGKLLQQDAALAGIDRIVVHDVMDEANRSNNLVVQSAVGEITSLLSIIRRDISATYDLLNLDIPGILDKFGDRVPGPSSSVSVHVGLARQSRWDAALAAYNAACSESVRTHGTHDNDAAAEAECEALATLARTRAPDIQTLLEKVSAIDSGEAWQTSGMIQGVLADIAALAHHAAQREG